MGGFIPKRKISSRYVERIGKDWSKGSYELIFEKILDIAEKATFTPKLRKQFSTVQLLVQYFAILI